MTYAGIEDFRKLFKDSAGRLYLLSLLLTAHPEKAERCFISGFEDCAKRRAVSLEMARTWAQRAIIRSAIREMIGVAGEANRRSWPSPNARDHDELQFVKRLQSFESILRLRKTERFVFVLSVLEQYSDRDCASWLKTSIEKIRQIRKLAFLHLAESHRRKQSYTAGSKIAIPVFRFKASGAQA